MQPAEGTQRAYWRAKAARQYATNPGPALARMAQRRRAAGMQTRAAQVDADRTVVGVGDRQCDRCGTSFTPYRMAAAVQRFCSPACRRANRSGHQVRIRYRLRAAVIAASAGVCYLCTRPLDESLRAPHPLSPSIDHVKPLALGGSDTIENLRMAHLACNIEKGDQLPPWWVAA